MSTIKIEHHPSEEKLKKAGIRTWPIWTKEESEFDWYYDSQETCYFLEGEVIVTPEDGQPVEIRQGDLVVFPAGMHCAWNVKKAVKKHYHFE